MCEQTILALLLCQIITAVWFLFLFSYVKILKMILIISSILSHHTPSSDIDSLQFQMTFDIPKISVKAQYRSTGVLILVQASGAGEYWGEYRKFRVL